MGGLLRLFNNLPIARKLLLTSVIPIVALIVLSVLTYESFQAFSDDEEQLNTIYLVQRRAAEFMRLVVDLETGFRGFVLTGQEPYLNPYREASERIPIVGDSLGDMVAGREPQESVMRDVRRLVRQLMDEKDHLIDDVMAGHTAGAR